jgi:hypothetical protein
MLDLPDQRSDTCRIDGMHLHTARFGFSKQIERTRVATRAIDKDFLDLDSRLTQAGADRMKTEHEARITHRA